MMRKLVLGAIGVGLVWGIASTSLVAFLAAGRPEVALSLNPGQSHALLLLAQRQLDKRLSGGPIAPQVQSGHGLSQEARDATAATFGRLSGWARAADGAVGVRSGDEERDAVAGGALAPASDGGSATGPMFSLSADEKAACAEVRTLALAVLVKEPLNAVAYRMLGQVASKEGDDIQAERFMKEAAKLSMRESIALHWLMRRAVETRDYATAAGHLDVILRTFPQLREAVLPSFAQVAEAPEGNGAVKAILARNPAWRRDVLWFLPTVVGDARTPLALLMHLKTTPHPPTTPEIHAYLSFLISKGFYELAYDTWLQFLPSEQLGAAGNVFNGRFQFPLSGLAFDWTLAARSGVTVDIVPLVDMTGGVDANGGRALSVEFNTGQVDFPGVTQTVVVRPGAYEFKGKFRGTLTGRRGLKWSVVCLDKPAVKIGESQMILSGSSTWQEFSFPVTIAASECGAQKVKLELDARSASERLVSGTMLFADIEIVRAGDGVGGAAEV
ncbi:MAG: hypothetical protein ABL901_02690, partial [Hyphomicrobiaceae bacterium]